MKNLLLIVLLAVTFSNDIFGQYYWTPPVRITTGYKDTNPDFASLQTSYYGYENGDGEVRIFLINFLTKPK